MNLINRIIIVFELITAMLISLVLLGLMLFSRASIQSLLTPTIARLSEPSLNISQIVCIGVLLLIFAFALLLMLVELQRSSPRRLRIKSIQGAEVLMTSDAITQQLEYTLDSLTDVLRVRPRVVSGGKGEAVDVFIELATTANVDVQAKTQEVMGVARMVLEDKLGLKVGKLQIKLDQMKAPAKRAQRDTLAKPASSEIKG